MTWTPVRIGIDPQRGCNHAAAAGQTPGTGGTEWFVFRVTDVTAPAVDLASAEMKNLKDTLQRSMVDEQLGQYVLRLQKGIGTSINEVAFAQVTGREQ